MPPSIPPVLAPYLQECLSTPSHVLLTSVLDTPTTWLVLRFLTSVLFGIDDDDRKTRGSELERSTVSGRTVTFISFIHPFELWADISKKMGIDLSALIASRRLAYIDGLQCGLFGASSGGQSNTIPIKSHALRDVTSAIATAKQKSAPVTDSSKQDVILIDGIDYVLASQPDVSLLQITQYLTSLHDQYSQVVSSLSADSALLHNIEPSATPLELDHSMFVKTAAHQSLWVLQLRPLETGHAKDVSGVIRISKGGSHDGGSESLPDGEWLYQVKGDASVRIWGRGE